MGVGGARQRRGGEPSERGSIFGGQIVLIRLKFHHN